MQVRIWFIIILKYFIIFFSLPLANGIFASHGDVGNQQKFDQNESTNNSIKFGIIGGYTINIREAPYQAAIIVNGNLFCGAVIISEHLILTTASCLIQYI